MQYVSTGDLVTRWHYTRQGINRWMKKATFPKPAFYVNNGRLPVWELPVIEVFEKDKPELHSEAAKQFKLKGYRLTLDRVKREREAQRNADA